MSKVLINLKYSKSPEALVNLRSSTSHSLLSKNTSYSSIAATKSTSEMTPALTFDSNAMMRSLMDVA